MNKNIGFILTATVLAGLGVAGVLVFRNSSNQSDLLYGINGELLLESSGPLCKSGGETCYTFESKFFSTDEITGAYKQLAHNFSDHEFVDLTEQQRLFIYEPEMVLGPPVTATISGKEVETSVEERVQAALWFVTGGQFGVYDFLETSEGEFVHVWLLKYQEDASDEDVRRSVLAGVPVSEEDAYTVSEFLENNKDSYVLVVSTANISSDYMEGVTRARLP